MVVMDHGRNHDSRSEHAGRGRFNDVPRDEDTTLEAEMLSSGRTSAHATAEEAGPPQGSRYAPTHRAQRRERERHRLERAVGRVAAGEEEGALRDQRAPGASRELLEEAARRATERTTDMPRR